MYPSRSYQTSPEAPLVRSNNGVLTGRAPQLAPQLNGSRQANNGGAANNVVAGRFVAKQVVRMYGDVLHNHEAHFAHGRTRLNVAEIPYGSFKAAFDFVGAVVLLTTAAPVMAAIALAIKCSSPGPVIFRQRRLTRLGKEFTIYKFRTMRADAEATSGAVWAQENDPRVTKLGSFLRITRLDELPQLFTVLKGDMSLIGPRPERPEFVETLSHELPGFHRRLQVKAGLTGLAQVGSGYSSCLEGHRKKLAYDRLYISKRSILLDLWITAKTVGVVITGRGAR